MRFDFGFPLDIARPETWLLAVLAGFAVALAWLAWRRGRLRREQHASAAEGAARIEQALDLRQREMLGGLHAALERQTDRLVLHAADRAERLGRRVEVELAAYREALQSMRLALEKSLAAQREDSAGRLAGLGASLGEGLARLRAELIEATLARLAEQGRADRELLANRVEALERSIDERLERISGRVNERLDEGFRKTNETFVSVMARLATIDEAQKKIDGLTSNVVSLQELLGDKRARGAFGEVQLEALVRNALPPDAWEFQATLSNGTRVDCLLRLPEPTGAVAVDSKFPLENYQRMFDPALAELDRKTAQSAFRSDVRRHIDAIATKYIIADQTADGAVMFLPAEAVFAEIHAYHPELVAHALARRVWIVSPTTLMAVLNTARAVLKDIETRKQVHVIKDALARLARDFGRFDERMQRLAAHIEQAGRDVHEVQVSSRKISAHFRKIESAQLGELEADESAAVGETTGTVVRWPPGGAAAE